MLERIEVAGDPAVRGVLHPAAGPDGLVLTHGAGGNMDAPLLIAVAEAFVARGVAGGHDLGWGSKRRDVELPKRIAETFLELLPTSGGRP